MTMTHNAAAQTPVKKTVSFSLILTFALIGAIGAVAFIVYILSEDPASFGIYEKHLTVTEIYASLEGKERIAFHRASMFMISLITLASSALGTYIALLRARKGVEALVFFPALFGAVAGVVAGRAELMASPPPAIRHLEMEPFSVIWASMSEFEKITFRDEVIVMSLILMAIAGGIGLVLSFLRYLVGGSPSPAAIERSHVKKQVRQMSDSVDARIRSLPKHKKVANVVAVDDEKEMLHVNTAWISIAKPKWVSIPFDDFVRWEANWDYKGAQQIHNRVIFFVRGELGPTIEIGLTSQTWREKVTGLIQANFS